MRKEETAPAPLLVQFGGVIFVLYVDPNREAFDTDGGALLERNLRETLGEVVTESDRVSEQTLLVPDDVAQGGDLSVAIKAKAVLTRSDAGFYNSCLRPFRNRSSRNGADLTSRMNRRLHFLPLGGRKYAPSARSYTKREYRRSGLSNEIGTIESGSKRPRSTNPRTAREKAACNRRSENPLWLVISSATSRIS